MVKQTHLCGKLNYFSMMRLDKIWVTNLAVEIEEGKGTWNVHRKVRLGYKDSLVYVTLYT